MMWRGRKMTMLRMILSMKRILIVLKAKEMMLSIAMLRRRTDPKAWDDPLCQPACRHALGDLIRNTLY